MKATRKDSLLDFSGALLARLAGSPLGGLVDGECIVDIYCGAGGASAGLEMAGFAPDFAVNHDAVAIDYHERNHPGCTHVQGDTWHTSPLSVTGGRPVGLLWASAACTTHSRARGSAPISDRVHMLGWCIARWAKDTAARVVICENVMEWLEWGPTKPKRDEMGQVVRDGQGRPLVVQDENKKGREFRKWVRYLKSLGYSVEWRMFDAADYGAACHRRRLFVVARNDGQPICWPEVCDGLSGHDSDLSFAVGREGLAGCGGNPRHASGGATGPAVDCQAACRNGGGVENLNRGVNGSGSGAQHAHARGRRCAADIIDWSDLGTSLFDRKKELAPKTQRRIAEGIRRYVLGAGKAAAESGGQAKPGPFTLRVTHGEGRGWHVVPASEPMGTQTTRQDLAVVTPVMQLIRGGSTGTDVRDVLPTITAGNGPGRGAGAAHAMGVATPVMTPCGGPKREPHDVRRPLHTVLVREDRGVATPVMVTTGYGERAGQAPRCGAVAGPLGTVVGAGKHAVAVPVGVTLRQNCGGADVREPLGTLTAAGTHHGVATGLCVPMLTEYYGNADGCRPVGEPMGTVVTRDRHGMVGPVLVAAMTAAMLERGRMVTAMLVRALGAKASELVLNADGLVVCVLDGVEFVLVDVLFRMLRPRELAAAMGFPAGYIWPSTQRHAVRLIGNAVSPPMAAALARAVLPLGRGGALRKAGVA